MQMAWWKLSFTINWSRMLCCLVCVFPTLRYRLICMGCYQTVGIRHSFQWLYRPAGKNKASLWIYKTGRRQVFWNVSFTMVQWYTGSYRFEQLLWIVMYYCISEVNWWIVLLFIVRSINRINFPLQQVGFTCQSITWKTKRLRSYLLWSSHRISV